VGLKAFKAFKAFTDNLSPKHNCYTNLHLCFVTPMVIADITPAKTQGLAPHHDDVEIFICQTQGARLYFGWLAVHSHMLLLKIAPY